MIGISPVQMMTEEEDEEEHFPIAPLNGDIWMEEPVPNKTLMHP